ncbi:alpha/beta hydrolase [Nocardia sp. NPDC051750]|uniref:alpha/beta hydrolase n=1 Tax=Nocardia sp. NPDC051750 TaxID=3364325 RepID=UPI0037B6A282
MRSARRLRSARPRRWVGRWALGITVALLAPLAVALSDATGPVQAAPNPRGFDFVVNSPEMGPIRSRIFRAKDGNTNRVVYALDGMRAPETHSGWEFDTNVADALTDWNINVVMPVGGMSSFYADWNAPSSFFGAPPTGSSSGSGALNVISEGPGKSYRYAWETFVTQHLRWALRDRLGFNPYRNGVFGLSMGGSGALTMAAYHPDQFSFAGSYSGYLNISAPGMREAIRMAMIDAGGYNVDSMAPPWGPQWLRMDPFVFAPLLRDHNTRLWISAGSGLPDIPVDGFNGNTINGMALETLALANTRSFQLRMMSLGANNVTYSFPGTGIHSWTYWQAEVYRMIPDLSANIG